MKEITRFDRSPINDGINNNTYNMLFKDYNLSEEEQGNYDNLVAYTTIDFFTRLKDKSLYSLLQKKLNKRYINNIKYNNDTKEYEYICGDIVIPFNKLSNFLKDKKLIAELTSNKRYHTCHSRAINLAPNIRGSKIVTGYVTAYKHKVLHSFVEYEENGTIFVLDWTKNLKIRKNDYVKLTNFEEINSFEGKKVLDDIKIFNQFNIGIKTYVVFRNELVKDFMRNPQLFSNNEDKKIKTKHL